MANIKEIIKWMTWFRINHNPNRIQDFYPAHPGLKSFEETLVNYINGVR